MQVYLVERSLKGIPMEQLAAAQQRAIRTAAAMRGEGKAIDYIRTTFVPETGDCMCLFSADDAQCVQTLNQRAEIPFDRVRPALDLRP